MATFEAAEPGQYTITSRYDPRGLAHLAVGENIGADFVPRMLGPVLLAAGTLLAAIAVPYIGYLIRGDMPFVQDPRGMAAIGLVVGVVASW